MAQFPGYQIQGPRDQPMKWLVAANNSQMIVSSNQSTNNWNVAVVISGESEQQDWISRTNIPVIYFAKEIDPNLARPTLKINGSLAKLVLTFLVK